MNGIHIIRLFILSHSVPFFFSLCKHVAFGLLLSSVADSFGVYSID